ncbi:hypothetical protein Tco_1256330 [Tanacetum coccineum]
MGLIDFITTSDMFKVKVEERTLVDEEFSLPKEIEDRVILPSDEIIIVVYHTIMDELRDAAVGKGGSKKIVAFRDSKLVFTLKATLILVPSSTALPPAPEYQDESESMALLRNISSLDFLDQYNVNAARQACMNSEIQLRLEYEVEQRDKLEKKLLRKEEDLEVTSTMRMKELADLGAKNAELIRQVFGLESLLDDGKHFDERVVLLDARLSALDVKFDTKLFPNMLEAMTAKRWVIGNGLRLEFMKFKESTEYKSMLGTYISFATEEAQRQGLEDGVVHGQAGWVL